MQPIDRTIACVSAKTVYGVVAVAVLHIPGCGEKRRSKPTTTVLSPRGVRGLFALTLVATGASRYYRRGFNGVSVAGRASRAGIDDRAGELATTADHPPRALKAPD